MSGGRFYFTDGPIFSTLTPWPPAATLAAIGRAAHCVAFAAFLKRAGWPAHRRAIFLRYTQTDAAAHKQGEIAMTASFISHSPPSARTGFCATPRR
jgi:hypothetical protein